MMKRSPFPPVFWIANTIEVLERFAYYGIYMGFGIYMTHLGYSKAQLGAVQSIFLLFSYLIPIISGTFADRYGFKKMLYIAYLAYLPSILLLIITKSINGIALSMLTIGFAAGLFKPLVSATVRAVTDKSNKTLGFGIFYAMVNIGGTFGPLVAGHLRAISWNYAFAAAAISIAVMFLITVFFYKEPIRDIEGETLGKKFKDMGVALSDKKFLLFLVMIGLMFWLPLWSFYNIAAQYIDKYVDTANLYQSLKSIFGGGFANLFSHPDEHGVWRTLGETIASPAYFIIIFQLLVSWVSGKLKALPAIIVGLAIASTGFICFAQSSFGISALVFLGVFLYGIGEMATAPRIQEYITWIAPKEKAGLYMGTYFLSACIGGFLSGFTYTTLYGYYEKINHPEYIWYTLSLHFALGIVFIYLFSRYLGEFKEQES
jgi:proton-dependent oligopeptide transporter, POT family